MDYLNCLKRYLLTSRGKILLLGNEIVGNEEHFTLLLTLVEELREIGYGLSEESILRMTKEDIIDFHKNLLPFLYGESKREFKPLFPGFPEQVRSMSEDEIRKYQLEAYVTRDFEKLEREHPWYQREEVEEESPRKLKFLDCLNKEELYQMVTNIVGYSGIASNDDMCVMLPCFFQSFPDYTFPENIPNKTIYAISHIYRGLELHDINDVLRVMAYRSGFTVEGKSLGLIYSKDSYSRIPSPSRKQRREAAIKIKEILDKKGIENCVIDARKYHNLWARLNKAYHLGDYEESKPFIHALFTNTERGKYRSWNSKLHKHYHTLNKDNFPELLDFIAKRPGEYMRRLDSLIRKAISFGLNPEELIIDRVMDMNVNSKLLLEVLNYYDKREAGAPRLVHDAQGRFLKKLPNLESIPFELSSYITVSLCSKICSNISECNKDGNILEGEKVYIDPELKYVPVPYNMKGMGSLLPRGTRYKLPEDMDKGVRIFVKWIDPEGEEDLDLHGYLVNSKGNSCSIGWNSGAYYNSYATFSGDVRMRKGDCAEFIDIDIVEAVKRGDYDYLVASIHNYMGRPLNSLDAWMGYKILSDDMNLINSDYIDKISAEYNSMAAFVIDLKNREIVILNTDLTKIPSSSTDLAMNIVKFYGKPSTLAVYDVISSWYIARGAEEVSTLDEATKVVNRDDIVDYTQIQGMMSL